MTIKQDIWIEKKSFDIDKLSKEFPIFKSTYSYLIDKYNKYELTVDETLCEIQMSHTLFYRKKKKGKGIPCYRQQGERYRITFPIVCVALFLSQDFVKVG